MANTLADNIKIITKIKVRMANFQLTLLQVNLSPALVFVVYKLSGVVGVKSHQVIELAFRAPWPTHCILSVKMSLKGLKL
jgi:hypothetical protein